MTHGVTHSIHENDGRQYHDISALREALYDGRTSARDALEACIDKIHTLNASVNALVHMDLDNARKTADACDHAIRYGHQTGPLHGVPVSVKEGFDWVDHPTTWGDPKRSENVAQSNSTVVQRLVDAGAVIVGKTNIPAYLGDWETVNPLFGATRNPYDFEHSAGGSSGGSAVAVATGMSYADIGSDQGGSIRLPAHYCGVYGLKPSWGLVPMKGHSPLGEAREPDIGVAGPLTRSARDSGLLLRAISGSVDNDYAWRLQLPESGNKPLGALRIAVLIDDELCPIDAEYRIELRAFCQALSSVGASVEMNIRPPINLARHTELMNLLVRAETSTKMPLVAALDAGRDPATTQTATGERALADRYAALDAAGSGLTHRQWLELHEERLVLKQQWKNFFLDYDLLICPAGASAAPPLRPSKRVAERTIPVNGEERPVLEQHVWFGIASLPGLPAITVPIGRLASGLPVGAQLVANHYEDLTLCTLAGLFANVTGPKL